MRSLSLFLVLVCALCYAAPTTNLGFQNSYSSGTTAIATTGEMGRDASNRSTSFGAIFNSNTTTLGNITFSQKTGVALTPGASATTTAATDANGNAAANVNGGSIKIPGLTGATCSAGGGSCQFYNDGSGLPSNVSNGTYYGWQVVVSGTTSTPPSTGWSSVAWTNGQFNFSVQAGQTGFAGGVLAQASYTSGTASFNTTSAQSDVNGTGNGDPYCQAVSMGGNSTSCTMGVASANGQDQVLTIDYGDGRGPQPVSQTAKN